MPGRVSHGAARLECACQAIGTLAAVSRLLLLGGLRWLRLLSRPVNGALVTYFFSEKEAA